MSRSAFLLALLGLTACNASAEPPAPTRYASTAVGRVDSASEARRLVAEVDGVIDSVLVARGQAVSAGQILLTIACGPRASEVAIARAAASEANSRASTTRAGARPEEIEASRNQVRAAEAELRDRRQQDEQGRALLERGFLARREADARANQLAGAQARLAESSARLRLLENGSRKTEIAAADAAHQAARAQLRRAEALLNQCSLRSPVAGHVLAILKREGEATGAATGETLVIVGASDALIVRAEVDERDAAAVHQGQRVEFWVTGGQRWHGRVTELAGVMGRRTARSLDPSDRFDRDVREVIVAIHGPLPPALVGLRVTVGFLP